MNDLAPTTTKASVVEIAVAAHTETKYLFHHFHNLLMIYVNSAAFEWESEWRNES
jgi:hypothetical protein